MKKIISVVLAAMLLATPAKASVGEVVSQKFRQTVEYVKNNPKKVIFGVILVTLTVAAIVSHCRAAAPVDVPVAPGVPIDPVVPVAPVVHAAPQAAPAVEPVKPELPVATATKWGGKRFQRIPDPAPQVVPDLKPVEPFVKPIEIPKRAFNVRTAVPASTFEEIMAAENPTVYKGKNGYYTQAVKVEGGFLELNGKITREQTIEMFRQGRPNIIDAATIKG
jgi:hypothetical protein